MSDSMKPDRTWHDIAAEMSAERDPQRMMQLVEELDSALQREDATRAQSPRYFQKLCNFEQSAHFGQSMIRRVRPGSHGLVPIGNIGVRTLTTAFFLHSIPNFSVAGQATRLNLGHALVSSQPYR
jgi:hypothetical protein